jgi:hypothetical protein
MANIICGESFRPQYAVALREQRQACRRRRRLLALNVYKLGHLAVWSRHFALLHQLGAHRCLHSRHAGVLVAA